MGDFALRLHVVHWGNKYLTCRPPGWGCGTTNAQRPWLGKKYHKIPATWLGMWYHNSQPPGWKVNNSVKSMVKMCDTHSLHRPTSAGAKSGSLRKVLPFAFSCRRRTGLTEQQPALVLVSALPCFRPEGAEAAAASGAQHKLMVSMMAILSAASLVDQSSSSPCSAVSARLCAEFIMTARSHPQQSHASQHTFRIHLSRRQNKREVGRVGLFLTLANAAAGWSDFPSALPSAPL